MATVDSSTDHHFLQVGSLPLVDLRFLSQSELYSLSLCSSSHILRGCDDDAIIPKIDRSVFNESAGSRKQTFSRLRLAPRNNQISSASVAPIQIPRQNSEPIDEESTQIIGVLQQLFGVESYGDFRHDYNNLVPVQFQFQDPLPEPMTVAFQSIPIDIVDVSQTKRKRGRPRKNGNVGIRVEEKPIKEGVESMTVVNSNGVLVDAVASVNVEDPFGVELKRRTQGLETESSTVAYQNISIDIVAGGQRKRKRGRPRKNVNAGIHMEEKPKEDCGEAITIVNNNGVLVNAVDLVNVEDRFGEELKRRTQGLQTEPQLLEFMGRLDGEWASQRKRRRIVQAGDFGDFLPSGWKIMLSIKRRAGHVWIICRRYISPDGRQFVSCKEVSSYLLSRFGLQDISNLESSHTDGSLQFLGKLAPENGVGLVPTSDMKAMKVSSNLLIPGASVCTDHANQPTLSSSIGSDEKNNSGDVNQELVPGTKLGGDSAACGMFTDFNHDRSMFIDEQPLQANRNDKPAVRGCSPEDDKVGNEANEKLDEVNDVASRPDAPLDVRNFSNNKSKGDCEFIDEINAVKCLKSGIGNFVNQDGNARCPETSSCGNAQPFVFNSSGYDLPVRLVDDLGEQIDFGSGQLPLNFEEKRRAADGLVDVNIRHGSPFENDMWLTNSGNCHSETEHVLNNFKLPGSSEGFSVVHSHIELKDISTNSKNRKDVLDIDPNVKVTRDVDDHAPHNEDVVTSFALEMSSLKEQSFGCKIDSSFTRSIEKKLAMPAGDEPPSAFNNNSNIVSSGTLDTLKTVEVICKNPQLDMVSCNNDDAVDAHIMGRSDGCASNSLSSSIQNKFEEQGHDGVDNADKFFLTKAAKGDQVEVCENDEAFLAISPNQIESGVDVTSSAWKSF